MLGLAPLGSIAIGQVGDGAAVVAASEAVLTITGHDATLSATRFLTIEPAAFTITGNAINMVRGRLGLQVVSGGGARGLRASSGGGGKGLRIRA